MKSPTTNKLISVKWNFKACVNLEIERNILMKQFSVDYSLYDQTALKMHAYRHCQNPADNLHPAWSITAEIDIYNPVIRSNDRLIYGAKCGAAQTPRTQKIETSHTEASFLLYLTIFLHVFWTRLLLLHIAVVKFQRGAFADAYQGGGR